MSATNQWKELETSKLQDLSQDLSPYEEVATITAINTTPWWGGDYRTYTHDPETKKLTALPTAETLKGAMLWVIRQAMQKAEGREISIQEANKRLAKYLGGKSGSGEEQRDSLIKIEVKAYALEEPWVYDALKQVRDILNRLRKIVEDALRKYISKGSDLSKIIEVNDRLINEIITSLESALLLPTLELLGWLSFYSSSYSTERNEKLKSNLGSDLINELKGNLCKKVPRIIKSVLKKRLKRYEIDKFNKAIREIQDEISNEIKSKLMFRVNVVQHRNKYELVVSIKDSENNIDDGKVKLLVDDKKMKLFKLFTIPRVKLSLMNANSLDDIYARIPALSGSVRLVVRVSVKKNLSESIRKDALVKLIVSSLVYALQIHGLGKGVSRGFGRFKVRCEAGENTNIEFGVSGYSEYASKIKDIIDITKTLSNPYKPLELINALTRLEGLIAEQLRELKLIEPSYSESTYEVNVEVIGKEDKGVVHPFPKPLSFLSRRNEDLVKERDDWAYVADDVEALSAIGYATLKVLWKRKAGFKVWETGAPFHTWILGLPRWQQETGYGYFTSLKLPAACVPKNLLEDAGNLRRLSNIVLFPVRGSSGKYYVVMLTYRSYEDHRRYVLGDSRESKVLCHVSKHGGRRRNRDKDHRTVVPVKEIIRRCGQRILCHGKPGCGHLKHTGIAGSDGTFACEESVEEGGFGEALNKVYSAAQDFIKKLLEGG